LKYDLTKYFDDVANFIVSFRLNDRNFTLPELDLLRKFRCDY